MKLQKFIFTAIILFTTVLNYQIMAQDTQVIRRNYVDRKETAADIFLAPDKSGDYEVELNYKYDQSYSSKPKELVSIKMTHKKTKETLQFNRFLNEDAMDKDLAGLPNNFFLSFSTALLPNRNNIRFEADDAIFDGLSAGLQKEIKALADKEGFVTSTAFMDRIVGDDKRYGRFMFEAQDPNMPFIVQYCTVVHELLDGKATLELHLLQIATSYNYYNPELLLYSYSIVPAKK